MERVKQPIDAFKPFTQADLIAILPVIISDLAYHAEVELREPTNRNIAHAMYARVIRGLYDEKTFLFHEESEDDSAAREHCFIKGYVRDVWHYLQDAYDLIHRTNFELLLSLSGTESRSSESQSEEPLKDLILPLKGEYFDQIKAGTKTEEYRLCNAHWKKRLEGRCYRQIILTRGYPKRSDTERRLTLPWKGFVVKTITHPHFGPGPVGVYAIDVAHHPEQLHGDTMALNAKPDEAGDSIRQTGWYWVQKQEWDGGFSDWVPALLKENDQWHSVGFSGVPSKEIIVGEPLVSPVSPKN